MMMDLNVNEKATRDSSGLTLPPEAPRWVCFGLPILTLVMLAAAPWLLGMEVEHYERVMLAEIGVLELATVGFLLVGIGFGVGAWRRRAVAPKMMGLVIGIGLAGAFFFAGEESSWGQWYFGFETPESMEAINHQDEFNLHNIRFGAEGEESDWKRSLINLLFNNGPRQGLMFGCLIGGVILPLHLRKRAGELHGLKSLWYWVLPTVSLAPMCLLAGLATVPEKLHDKGLLFTEGEYGWFVLVLSGGELKEYCFAGVVMLYFISLYTRLGEARGE